MLLELLALSAASSASDNASKAASLADKPQSTVPLLITLTKMYDRGGWTITWAEKGKETISANIIKTMYRDEDNHYTYIKMYGGTYGRYKETPEEIEQLIDKKIKDMINIIRG